jgi:hypothetical protein
MTPHVLYLQTPLKYGGLEFEEKQIGILLGIAGAVQTVSQVNEPISVTASHGAVLLLLGSILSLYDTKARDSQHFPISYGYLRYKTRL